jgi:hypothetical protein
MMFPLNFMVLLGCAHLLLSKSVTQAFVATAELSEAIRHFLDTFEMYGGREFVRRIEQGEPIDEQDFQELDDAFGIPCLLKTVRLNVYPRKPIYKPIFACLTDEPGFPDCSQDQIKFVDKLDASDAEFRYLSDASGQSKNLLGVFWTDYRGLAGSSLLSYAESKEGGRVSTGKFEKDKENISYRHRPAGDRVWAFSGKNGDFFTSPIDDLIYESRVTEGSDDNPTRIQIFPSFSMFHAPFVRFHFRECFDWRKCASIGVTGAQNEILTSPYCRFFISSHCFMCTTKSSILTWF